MKHIMCTIQSMRMVQRLACAITRWIPGLLLLYAPVAFGQVSPVPPGAELERLIDGVAFGEGPLWHPDGYLLYSELNADRIMQFDPQTSQTNVFLEPTGTPNGLAFDMDRRLTMCRRDAADIARLESDGSITVLASEYDQTPFNGPNDITIRSDNVIFFTDPNRTEAPDRFDGVYALHTNGEVLRIDSTLNFSNGITLSPSEDRLYVNAARDRTIYVYERQGDSTYANRQVFAAIPEASYLDGMKTDVSGRLYVTGGGGIWIYSSGGMLLEHLPMGGFTTNLNWGEADYRTLYVTQINSLHRIEVNADGFVLLDTESDERLPGKARLLRSFPNPFQESTDVVLELGSATAVEVTVYDLMGRVVRILERGYLPPGIHHLRWDGRDTQGHKAASGIYLCRLTAGTSSHARTIVLIQ